MLFSRSRIVVKVYPSLSKVKESSDWKINFQILRRLKSDKLNEPLGGREKQKTYGEPFPELPPLSGVDDENFTKYYFGLLKNPFLLRYSARNFAKECKKFYEMKREEHNNEFIIRDPVNHVDMLYTFEKEEDVEKFLITSDSTNNTGTSSGTLVLTQDKTALFSGYLNTEPLKTGNAKIAGFVNMLGPRKSAGFLMKGFFDWTKYTHLVLKVRGDGRSYLIGLTTPQKYEEVQGLMYAQPLFTRGGPYWQIAKMPFSHFYFLNRGRMTDNQNNPIALRSIGNFGITAAGFDGSFKLEIDYVGLEFDPYHIRASPYEEYWGDY